MIEAIIFDMDGVLIDSEPIWKQSEKKVFASVGINLTDEMCSQTTGFDGITAVTYWYNYQQWSGKSMEQVKSEIEMDVLSTIEQSGKARDGVLNLLHSFSQMGLKMAVASSSPLFLINAVLQKLNINSFFSVIHSSESEVAGKPHPAVYLSAASMLGVDPLNCLAFEDSINGFMAAQKAGMKTVVIPDVHLQQDPRYLGADQIITCLTAFNPHQFNFIQK